MKYLICFLLFSTVVFSQNYHYAIEETQNKLPTAPTGLVASQITQTSVDLTWTASVANTSVSAYWIYNKNTLLAKSVGNGTAYTVTGLTSDTVYSLTVRTIDNAGKISSDSNIQAFTTEKVATVVKNQLGEIEYFKAHLLPLSEKANLQKAIDTYGSVRLERGDYSGVNVVLHSNQSLYGHPATNNITSITIAAGSTNVRIESLKPAKDSALFITFQAGGVISNCTLKTLKYSYITATNAMIENNTFIDIIGQISFDCSASGYFRNNKIIKHQSQGNSEMMVMKGNRTTPSYGNINMHSNYLGSLRQTTDIDNLESATFIGTDAETYWGLSKELLHINNVDKLKLMITNGNISYDSGFGFSNLDATEVYAMQMNGGSSTLSKVSPRTNLLNFSSSIEVDRGVNPITGFNANFYNEQVDRDIVPHFKYNGVEKKDIITDPATIAKLTNSLLGTQRTPWPRPNLETILPDPLGPNWRAERVGKPDSTSYIQNLINTNGVADLPEGIFYIGSTLNILNDGSHGIMGQGTGKTVIVGLTDNFPLLSVTTGDFGSIILGNLTLQGGSDGLYTSNPPMMVSYQSIKYVVFRDQTYGMHFKEIFGLDNNFYDHLAFINCTRGVFQEPSAVYNPNLNGSTYMDKNVFYQSQFINCNTALYLHSVRASNLNAWVDCKFDGGVMAADMQGDTTIFANCDFTHFTGDYTLRSNMFNLISCNFYNNTNAKATLYSIFNNIEGCNFLDNTPLGGAVDGNPVQNNIFNSTITGNAIVMPNPYQDTNSLYVNSKLLSNPTFSKLLVRGVSSVPTVLIDAAPNPYPQLLVNQ